MRARMALFKSGTTYEHREIILRDKPEHMLKISPKGTVPVLLLSDGTIIDESIDIMHWALNQNDPDNWRMTNSPGTKTEIATLIKHNDNDFKPLLDRYKYPNRYPDEPKENLGSGAREKALPYLKTLEKRLGEHNNLFRNAPCMADMATFPFFRQFAHVDREWFNAQNLPKTQEWLENHKSSDIFKTIMKKYDPWKAKDQPTIIN